MCKKLKGFILNPSSVCFSSLASFDISKYFFVKFFSSHKEVIFLFLKKEDYLGPRFTLLPEIIFKGEDNFKCFSIKSLYKMQSPSIKIKYSPLEVFIPLF